METKLYVSRSVPIGTPPDEPLPNGLCCAVCDAPLTLKTCYVVVRCAQNGRAFGLFYCGACASDLPEARLGVLTVRDYYGRPHPAWRFPPV